MRKRRLSNMELLRVVSMLFVLIHHANFMVLHPPTKGNLDESLIITFIRCYIEALTIVAVNVFVLISGWFGIHFSFKKLGDLCFQVLFFTLGFFLVFLLIKPSEALTVDRIKGIFLLNGDYWFVKAYIILFILSPVLNAFVNNATKKQLAVFLFTFYIFHTFYGWLMDASVRYTMNGTTALSFIGIYMLGRYLRLYPSYWTSMNPYCDIGIYLVLGGVITGLHLLFLSRGIVINLNGRLYSYASPLIIMSSVYLLLFFSKISFTSKIVNWIAASCFAVYLFHCNGFFFEDFYRKVIDEIYKSPYSLCVGVYVILVYVTAVLLDKVRLGIWNIFQNWFK